MDFSTTITVGGKRGVISMPKERRAWQLANSIFIPLGPAHSVAYLVLSRKSLTELLANVGPYTIVWAEHPPAGGGSGTALTFQGWRLKNSERLLHGGPGDDKA